MSQETDVSLSRGVIWREPTTEDKSKDGFWLPGRRLVSASQFGQVTLLLSTERVIGVFAVCLYFRSGKFNAFWWERYESPYIPADMSNWKLMEISPELLMESFALKLGCALAGTSWNSLEEAQDALAEEIEKRRTLVVEAELERELQMVKEAKEATSKKMGEALERLPRLRVPGFPTYVGGMLAKFLPYRKQNILFGPQVCEVAALKPMCKVGFMLGCCVAIWSRAETELTLGQEAAPDSWDAFVPQTGYFWQYNSLHRLTEQRTTYETLLPEGAISLGHSETMLMRPEQCQAEISMHVLWGLLYGIWSFGDEAWSVIDAWTSQSQGFRHLGVGGLSVSDAPMFTSVEEGSNFAGDIYSKWRLYEEVSKDAEETISRLRQNPWFHQH